MSSRYFDKIEMHPLKIVSSPLIKGGLRGDRHPPYQGGIKGGSI
ncbi:hypothetical protein N0824_02325 [Microcystis sp. 0824]|nr:hypothetical protein N0824_02325 [Microcystis sp. 0824]